MKALGKQCFFDTSKISLPGIVSSVAVWRISLRKYAVKLFMSTMNCPEENNYATKDTPALALFI